MAVSTEVTEVVAKHDDSRAPEKTPHGDVEGGQRETFMVEFSDDLQDPFDWPDWQKWSIAVLVVTISFLMNLSTSIVAPSLDTISEDLDMEPDFEGPLVMSVYLLALALGPVLLAPFSELYGRAPLIQFGTIMYFIFNLACGFAKTRDQLLAFRLLSGFGRGASPTVGVGIISDCFPAEQRGKASGVMNMAFIFATPAGAIIGGFATQSSSWRVAFYATSAAAGVLSLVAIFIHRESYKPVLLRRRRKQLAKKSNGHCLFKTPYDDDQKTLAELYHKTLIRPIYFLTTKPIVQALSIYTAFIYGLTYLIFSTLPTLWENHYHEEKDIATLHFIAPGIGYFFGIVLVICFMDKVYCVLRRRNNGVGKPEFRLPLLAISALFVPMSLFWYGWTAKYRIHWVSPNIAIAVLMAGCTIVFQCVTAYLIDAFPQCAASASAASFLMRGLSAFGFPLFGPTMYENLGYGWGNSLLGYLALGIAVPVPALIWKYGGRLRNRGGYI